MLRVLVFGVMGLLVAALGTVAYVGLQPSATVAEQPHKQVSILAAAHAVRAGSLLQPADLAAHEVEEAHLPAGARRDTAEERSALVGAMARRTLAENDAIVGADVLRPGDRGFLAAVLAPGARAVSVAVDAVSGEAGLIWPGDRVDVILTQTLDGQDQSLSHRVAGETVLGDVRVIAVDQQLVQGGQASGVLDQHGQPNSRTITLEVTPHDAARVAVATRLGKLQVVLRAAEPDTAGTTPAPIPGGAETRMAAAGRPTVVPTAATAAMLLPPPARTAPPSVAGTPAVAGPPAAPGPGAATVWGGDVSQALGDGGAPSRNVEIRLFDGSRKVEAYKF